MNPNVRQLLEDIRHHAAVVHGHSAIRDLELPPDVQRSFERANFISSLELQEYVHRIDAALPSAVGDFERAALVTSRAWFGYFNGATMIASDGVRDWIQAKYTDAGQFESIDMSAVISSIDTAIARSGDSPGWDNVEEPAI